MTPEEKNVNSLREERERKPKHKYAGQIQETTTKTLEKVIDSFAVNVE